MCNFSSLYFSLSPKFSNCASTISPNDKVFNFSYKKGSDVPNNGRESVFYK